MSTPEGKVVFSQMRKGVQSIAPMSENDAFMQLGPHILFGVFERFAPYTGSVSTVFADFRNIMMFVARTQEYYLAFTMSRQSITELPEIISVALRSLQELIQPQVTRK